MEMAVGLPDLHPGRGHPIGAAFISRRIIYPFLVGGDIGCGMSLVQLPVSQSKLSTGKKIDRWANCLQDLDEPLLLPECE